MNDFSSLSDKVYSEAYGCRSLFYYWRSCCALLTKRDPDLQMRNGQKQPKNLRFFLKKEVKWFKKCYGNLVRVRSKRVLSCFAVYCTPFMRVTPIFFESRDKT